MRMPLRHRDVTSRCEFARTDVTPRSPHPRDAPRLVERGRSAGRRLWALPLELRILAFSLVVLVVGAVVFGDWVSRAIRDGVVDRTGEVAALYVESFVTPELPGEPFTGALSLAAVSRLDPLLESTALGDGIVSFKVWSRDGTIRYASDTSLIGETFPTQRHVAAAFDGSVTSEISDLQEEENRYEAIRWTSLLETYAPIRSTTTGNTIAAAEFYQLPDDLLAEVRDSQRTGWLIVGAATLVMFLLLNGLERGASRTIQAQTARPEALTDRLRTVSAAKIETDEAIFRRVSQDLHDGATHAGRRPQAEPGFVSQAPMRARAVQPGLALGATDRLRATPGTLTRATRSQIRQRSTAKKGR